MTNQETPPPITPRQDVYLKIVRLAGAVESHLTAILRKHGLTLASYNALRILRGAGSGGLSVGKVGERMLARVPNVTRLLNSLEKDGLIDRGRDSDDRRVVHAWITKAGLAVLAKLDQPVVEAHEAQFAQLTNDQLSILQEILGLAFDQFTESQAKARKAKKKASSGQRARNGSAGSQPSEDSSEA